MQMAKEVDLNSEWTVYSIFAENIKDPFDLLRLINSSPIMRGCIKFINNDMKKKMIEQIFFNIGSNNAEAFGICIKLMYSVLNNVTIPELHNYGASLIDFACLTNNVDILDMLSKNPFKLDSKNMEIRIITNICRNRNLQILQRITQPPFRIDRLKYGGNSYHTKQLLKHLYELMMEGHIEMAKILMASPYNLLIRLERKYHDVLRCGLKKDNLEIIDFAIEFVEKMYGKEIMLNEFMYSLRNGKINAAKYLTKRYNFNAGDVDGDVIKMVCETGNSKIINFIMEPPFSIDDVEIQKILHENIASKNKYKCLYKN